MAIKRKAAIAPFRIYCGWDSRQAEAAEVFAFSVREHASIPVQVEHVSIHGGCIWTMQLDGAVAGGNGLRAATRTGVTQFSYARFYVPWICDYQGRALFADGADMVCLGDVAELADWDMAGHAVRVVKHEFMGQARPRIWTSLMLMDCAKLTAWTPEFVEAAPDEALMRFGGFPDALIGGLPTEWNMMVNPTEVTSIVSEHPESLAGSTEPSKGAKIAHWSYLSQPEGGSWIDRSGSRVWMAARDRWREVQARSNISTDADIFNGGLTR